MLERFLRWRWAALALLVVAVGAFTPGLKRAMIPDNAITVWFLDTDPQLEKYRKFHKNFGNDEVVLLQVESKAGIFNHKMLTRLSRLEKRLNRIEGVERITSLLNVQDAYDTPKGLRYAQLMPRPIPSEGAKLAAIGRRAIESKVFNSRLISPDGKRAMLWIQMRVMHDIDVRRDSIVKEIRTVADDILKEIPHPMGGIGVIYSGLNVITQHDFGLFVGLGYLIMFAMLWWIFRSFRLLLAALGVIILGNLAALGIYGVAGHQMNMVTVVLPILIVVLGIADAVHFPAAFILVAEEKPDLSRFEQVRLALKQVFLPCLFTTLTTMGGFLALSSSPMAVIRHLGIYAAIGLGVALLASTVIMTLAFFGLRKGVRLPQHKLVTWLLGACRNFLFHRRPWLVALSFLLVAAAGVGTCFVKTDTYSIGYLPESHRVVKDHKALEKGWGAYSVLDYLVHPEKPHTMRSAKVLNGLERFIRSASELKAVRNGFSLADVYRRMIKVLGSNKKLSEPLRQDEVGQLALVLEMQGFRWDKKDPAYHQNVLQPFMTEDERLGRLILVAGMTSAKQLEAILATLGKKAKAAMGDAGSLEPAGYPPLYVRIIDYVMNSQIRSFFLALGIILILMLLWLRSLRLALISLVPNIFPVLIIMGMMGALRIHLDIATATVAAIVIGVAIDDTVHFLHHWRDAERQGLSWEAAVNWTYARAGSPAVVTTLLLLIGYPVLMLAGVKTVVYFGLLTTLAAAAALYGDLFILPLLLKAWPARKRPSAIKGDMNNEEVIS